MESERPNGARPPTELSKFISEHDIVEWIIVVKAMKHSADVGIT